MDPDQSEKSVPVCWVVTDGRAGIEAQALGLAEAIARLAPLEIVLKKIALRPPWRMLPSALVPAGAAFASVAGDFSGPPADLWPDLWIGCGRQSTPLTIAAARLAPAPFRVQLQNPRAPLGRFDLVIAPTHDGLEGPNVFSILGAPNRITSARIDESARALSPRINDLPSPRVAVLLGGPNRAYAYPPTDIARLSATLADLAGSGVGLLVTASRRTPVALVEAVADRLRPFPHLLYAPDRSADAPNPYPGLFGAASHALVTADSVNMMGEAASAGLPVGVLPLTRSLSPSLPSLGGEADKFARFRDALCERGLARPFDGRLESWTPPPFDETARAAQEVLRRWRAAA